MSIARPIHPGKTYLITRRTERRHCLLRPDSRMNRYILYALTVSAVRHGILVHAFCTMSTHLHYVVTDPLGALPQFFEMFHRLLTRGIKKIRQWGGSPWERVQTSAVELCSAQAIIEKIAYTLANPVQAGLVRYATQWPGAKTLAADIGNDALVTQRPEDYFDPKNPNWPEYAELDISLPPGVEKANALTFRNAVRDEIDRLEKAAHKLIPKHKVLGAKKAMMVRPEHRITSHEPKEQFDPKFAFGRNASEEIRLAAINTLKTFRHLYREAWAKWQGGARDIEFPAGTYNMRLKHKVRVASAAMSAITEHS